MSMSSFDPAPESPPPAEANRFMLLYAAVVSGIALLVLMFTLGSAITDLVRLLWPEFWMDPALGNLTDDAPRHLREQALYDNPASIAARARQSLVRQGIMFIVVGPVFAIHWMILRRAWKRRKA